jgi:ABC-type polysaccharide/polyol phosphate export permease
MFLLFLNFLEKSAMHTSLYTLWILPLFINLFILSLAVSLILSNIYILAKDITQVWQVFTQVLFFLSPILYNLDRFKTALPRFDYLNPLAGIIINARKATMEGANPDFKLFFFDFGYAILLLILGMFLLNKLGSKAAEKL